jgi:hypothetical protein
LTLRVGEWTSRPEMAHKDVEMDGLEENGYPAVNCEKTIFRFTERIGHYFIIHGLFVDKWGQHQGCTYKEIA